MKATVIDPNEMAEIDALVGTAQKDMAFGGAYDGAARFDKGIASWSPPLQSADADMFPVKGLVDARARDVGRNDAYVQGGATIHKDGIVGAMYVLNAKPNIDALATASPTFTEDWATEFQKEAEALFTIWAESPRKWVDASGQNTFTSLIRLTTGVYTFAGESSRRSSGSTSADVSSRRLSRWSTRPFGAAGYRDAEPDDPGRHQAQHARQALVVLHPGRPSERLPLADALVHGDQRINKEVRREALGPQTGHLHPRRQMRVTRPARSLNIVSALKEIHITLPLDRGLGLQPFSPTTLDGLAVLAKDVTDDRGPPL